MKICSRQARLQGEDGIVCLVWPTFLPLRGLIDTHTCGRLAPRALIGQNKFLIWKGASSLHWCTGYREAIFSRLKGRIGKRCEIEHNWIEGRNPRKCSWCSHVSVSGVLTSQCLGPEWAHSAWVLRRFGRAWQMGGNRPETSWQWKIRWWGLGERTERSERILPWFVLPPQSCPIHKI